MFNPSPSSSQADHRRTPCPRGRARPRRNVFCILAAAPIRVTAVDRSNRKLVSSSDPELAKFSASRPGVRPPWKGLGEVIDAADGERLPCRRSVSALMKLIGCLSASSALRVAHSYRSCRHVDVAEDQSGFPPGGRERELAPWTGGPCRRGLEHARHTCRLAGVSSPPDAGFPPAAVVSGCNASWPPALNNRAIPVRRLRPCDGPAARRGSWLRRRIFAKTVHSP